MVLTDTSQTARTTRLKARTLAGWRSANPGKPEQGPGGQTTDYTTTYTASRLGNKPFYGVGVEGLIEPPGSNATGCGCPSISGETFTITGCDKVFFLVTAGSLYTFVNTLTQNAITIQWRAVDDSPIGIPIYVDPSQTVDLTAPPGATSVEAVCTCYDSGTIPDGETIFEYISPFVSFPVILIIEGLPKPYTILTPVAAGGTVVVGISAEITNITWHTECPCTFSEYSVTCSGPPISIPVCAPSPGTTNSYTLVQFTNVGSEPVTLSSDCFDDINLALDEVSPLILLDASCTVTSSPCDGINT